MLDGRTRHGDRDMTVAAFCGCEPAASRATGARAVMLTLGVTTPASAARGGPWNGVDVTIVGMGLLAIVSLVLLMQLWRTGLRSRRAADRMSAMLDTQGAMVAYVDREMRYVTCNRAYRARWSGSAGSRPGDLRGLLVEEVHGEKRFAVTRPHLERALAGEPVTFEVGADSREDASRVVEVSYTPDVDAGGRVRGVVMVGRVVTGERRAGRDLADANRMLRMVLDTIPVRVFWKDRDSRYLGCNGLFAKDAGLERPEDLLGLDDRDMGWAEQAELYRSDDRAVMESERAKLGYEEPQTTPDGRRIWLRTSKIPLRDREGRVMGVLGTYEDVTARKSNEEALRKSERDLAITLDSIGDAVIATDADGVVSRINPVAESLTGWSREEAVGRPMAEVCRFVDGRTGEPIRGPAERVLETKRAVALSDETMLESRDGSRRRVADSAAPIRDEAGSLVGVVLVFRDVTEQHDQAAALDAERERLGQIVDGAPIPMFVLDREHRVTHWNRACEQMLGLSAEDVVGTRDAWRAFYDEPRPVMADLVLEDAPESEVNCYYGDRWRWSRVIPGALEAEGFFPHLGEGGRWLFFTGAAIRDDTGRVVGALETLQDTTERKRAEEGLRESESKYRTLFDSANDAIFIMRDNRIETCNRKTTEMFRCGSDEITGRTPIELSPAHQPDGRPSSDAALGWIADTLERGAQVFEWRHRRPDGTEFDAEVSLTPLSLAEGARLLAVVRDVTERKEAEANQRRQIRIFDATSDIISSATPDERILYLNDAGCAMLRVDRERVADMRVSEMHPEWSYTLIREEGIPSAIREGVWEGETAILVPDFGEVAVSQVIMSHRGPDGEVEYLSTILRDITERKRIERDLQESRERLHVALEGAQLGTFDWHIPTGELILNERWAAMLGYRLEKLVPRYETWEGLVHPDDLELALHRVEEHLRGDRPVYQMEHRLRSSSGEWRWVQASGMVMERDEEGRPLRMIGTHLDITERKLAEEEAARAQAILRAAIAQSPAGIVIAEAPTAQVTMRNAAADRAIGNRWGELASVPLERANEVIGILRPNGEPYDPSDYPLIRALRRGELVEQEDVIIRWKNGQERWIAVNASPIRDSKGVIVAGISIFLDITERKRAERALAESEEHYRAVFESASNGFLVFDLDGQLVDVNRAACEMRGYSRDEMLAMDPRALIHPGAEPKLLEVLDTVRAGEAVHREETRGVRRDGTAFEAEVSGVPYEYRGHEMALVTLLDMTQRNEAERALVDSERRFRVFFESAPFGAALLDRDGRVLVSNDRLAAMLGREGASLSRTPFWDLTHPDDIESGLAAFAELIGGGREIYRTQIRCVRSDGGVVWADLAVSGVRDESGELRQIIAMVADLTDQKRAERALRASEARLASLIRVAPIGIGVVIDRVLRRVNNRICEMLACTPDDLIGKSSRVMYPDDAEFERVGEAKYRQIRERGTGTVETRWQRKDGIVIDVLLSSTPVDPEDLSAGVTFTALDITDRKAAENALIAQAESERMLLRELDHRVRNNLSSLIALIDLSRSTATSTDELADAIRRRTETIAKVHTVLSTGHWRSVELRILLDTLIQPDLGVRVRREGPAVTIPLAQAQAMGIVINEMTTNSLKHGTLGRDGGSLEVTWRTRRIDEREVELELEWTERGGPPVTSQPVPGVGTELITGLVASELRGEAKLRYEPAGVRHTLRMRLTEESTAQFHDGGS
jgi:PAS domain S-box-containing protein